MASTASSSCAPSDAELQCEHTPKAVSYAARKRELEDIFARADLGAFRRYKEAYPALWQADLMQYRRSVDIGKMLSEVFKHDVPEFLDDIGAIIAARDLATMLIPPAVAAVARKCVEELCRRSWPHPEDLQTTTDAIPENWKETEEARCRQVDAVPTAFTLFLRRLTELGVSAKYRSAWALVPRLEDEYAISSRISVSFVWQTAIELIFEKAFCECVACPPKLQHTCGSTGVLCCPLLYGQQCPANPFQAADSFWEFLFANSHRLERAIVPWLLLSNAPARLLEKFVDSMASYVDPLVFEVLRRLPVADSASMFPKVAARFVAYFIKQYCSSYVLPLAPSQENIAELIGYLLDPATRVEDPGCIFQAYIVALVSGREDAPALRNKFVSLPVSPFSLNDVLQWSFGAPNFSFSLMTQLVDAAGLLYKAQCREASVFGAKIASYLDAHSLRTDALTEAMDAFVEFAWTPRPVVAKPAYHAASSADTAAPKVVYPSVVSVRRTSCFACWRC